MRQERTYYCGPASLRLVQRELGHARLLSQREWAFLAGTTKAGTSVHGIKKCLSLLTGKRPMVVRVATDPFHLAVVHDADRDHWMAARTLGPVTLLMDPETGLTTALLWDQFRDRFLTKVTKAYALVVR